MMIGNYNYRCDICGYMSSEDHDNCPACNNCSGKSWASTDTKIVIIKQNQQQSKDQNQKRHANCVS
jgi:RNA polymerase subunit RPABC4/transcription elongation factor Spt4